MTAMGRPSKKQAGLPEANLGWRPPQGWYVERYVKNIKGEFVKVFDRLGAIPDTQLPASDPMADLTPGQVARIEPEWAKLTHDDRRLFLFHFDSRIMARFKTLQEWVEPFHGMESTAKRYDALRQRLTRLDKRFPLLAQMRALHKVTVQATPHMDAISDSVSAHSKKERRRRGSDEGIPAIPETHSQEHSAEADITRRPPDPEFVDSPKTLKDLEDAEQKDLRFNPQTGLRKAAPKPTRKRRNS